MRSINNHTAERTFRFQARRTELAYERGLKYPFLHALSPPSPPRPPLPSYLFRAQGEDGRLARMCDPSVRIDWLDAPQRQVSVAAADAGTVVRQWNFFHIPKCAGTSLAQVKGGGQGSATRQAAQAGRQTGQCSLVGRVCGPTVFE